MALLKKLFVLLLLLGFSASSYAAVSDIELASCGVFSEGDAAEGGDKATEEEEEPDCE